MQNATVFNLVFRSPAPGADPELWERWIKWAREVYTPLFMKLPMSAGNDNYQIIRESPEYPSYGFFAHFPDNEAAEEYTKTQHAVDMRNEGLSWIKRGVVVDHFWASRYELIKSFRSSFSARNQETTTIDDAPVMHMEAYSLTPEEEEQYGKWINDYGINVFFPLFIKLPGLKGYDCFKCLNRQGVNPSRERNYPLYLSVVYFEDIKAFENFEKSDEVVACQKALINIFPLRPVYKWYVQYKLVQSFRK